MIGTALYRQKVEWDDKSLACNAAKLRWRIPFADISTYERHDKVTVGDIMVGKRPGLRIFTYGGTAYAVRGDIFSAAALDALAARLDTVIGENLDAGSAALEGEPSAMHLHSGPRL